MAARPIAGYDLEAQASSWHAQPIVTCLSGRFFQNALIRYTRLAAETRRSARGEPADLARDRSDAVKIVVCTKQVPSVEDVRFNRDKGTIVREGVPNEINPFDRRALGQAIELKNQLGAEVVAVTMGPPQAREVLWECLAVGADRAIHINDPLLAGSDTLATARVLAALSARAGRPDLLREVQRGRRHRSGRA